MKQVPLYGKKAAGRVALVDDEDYDLVMAYRWNISGESPTPGRRPHGPYARSVPGVRGGHNIFMHVLIMGRLLIDHIDHDGLNNQRYNLRPATDRQNRLNQRPLLGTSSRFKGVTWHKGGRKWQAAIRSHGRSRHLGLFLEEEAAARAYDMAAVVEFGEFAYLNFPASLMSTAVGASAGSQTGPTGA